MIDQPEIFSKLINWATIPITGMVGILGFHYKKLNTKVDRIDEDITELRINTAVTKTDMDYVKESCDKINERLERIETKLHNE
mgnify:CR=1 FL=1